jgi:NAD(P)H-hydrate epimerase
METWGLLEDVLMERASLGAWAMFRGRFAAAEAVVVVCGPGANGGDGMALARHAFVDGIRPVVVGLGREPDPTSAAGRQREILRRLGVEVVPWSEFRDGGAGAGMEHAVDALFGTGLSRALEGQAAEAAAWLSTRQTLALDLPSGLDGATGRASGPCVRAVATATFGRSKPGLHLHPGRDFAGEVRVVDLGLPPASWDFAQGAVELLDGRWARDRLATRPRGTHKGGAGRVFLLCGSNAYPGAAILCASASLRSGAGLVSVGTTDSVVQLVVSAVPEAVASVAVGEAPDAEALRGRVGKADALLAGPGLGTSPQAATALESLLRHARGPVVLDADALNLVASSPELSSLFVSVAASRGGVLTPHPLEASRLLATPTEVLLGDPLQAASLLASRFGCVAVFKTSTPVVASPDGRLAIGVAGHPGMAVGGMGDALAGAVAARLAEGVDPFEATCQAVRAHARAGELGGARGRRGMSVTDLVAVLPQAWEEMERP